MQAFARLYSSAASRRVIAGVSCAVTRPCYRTWRGKAHEARLSAQEPPRARRGCQRMKGGCSYQASNDGKFLTIKNVRQHAGGSHYTVRDVLHKMMYNQTKLLLAHSKAAQLYETTECAEQSMPKEDSGNNSFNPQRFNGKQDPDGTLLSQKDPATGTIIMENIEVSISLEIEAKEDSVDRHGETEVKHLSNVEKLQNASEPTISDRIGSDKVIKGNVLDISQRDTASLVEIKQNLNH
ncbi:hypothetical protein BRADI_3g49758v3 [Brachypodium distachyon]|uniref:AT3G52170-like helix-turn-helix domain-containing protein n=1 Tax=Brachypodium distachyon TaxID=15368 RepID=A0A0Q3M7T2_BRADI|nr:hypothetical protein BRADI_3g49758v3 [Brachypodium distachyon]